MLQSFCKGSNPFILDFLFPSTNDWYTLAKLGASESVLYWYQNPSVIYIPLLNWGEAYIGCTKFFFAEPVNFWIHHLAANVENTVQITM